jgi:hypothetical protein
VMPATTVPPCVSAVGRRASRQEQTFCLLWA